jgi:hypothetical protein
MATVKKAQTGRFVKRDEPLSRERMRINDLERSGPTSTGRTLGRTAGKMMKKKAASKMKKGGKMSKKKC